MPTHLSTQDNTVRKIRNIPGLILSGDIKVGGRARSGCAAVVVPVRAAQVSQS